MYRFIILGIIFMASYAFCQSQMDSLSTIRGSIWYTESYCMGTPPDKLNDGHPYANITLYVISKKNGSLTGEIIHQLTSDENGNFEFTIPMGNYTIQRYPYPTYLIKKEDIVWTQGPEYYLTVNSLEHNLQFGFYKPCPDGPERM